MQSLATKPEEDKIMVLKRISCKLRRHTLEALYEAGSGHAGASLSIAEILTVLYFDEMRFESGNKDRLILSKGHAAPMLYAAFHELGWIDHDELMTLRQPGSRLQGHPDRTKLPMVDAGTGALGQGLSITLGYALAAKRKQTDARCFCVVGDGELQEGQIWEAALFAPPAKLNNVCVIVDANRLQNETWVVDTLPIEPIAEKWESFGWQTLIVDGHDIGALLSAFEISKSRIDKPTCIVANTVKGKGVSFMENDNAWHGKSMSEEQFIEAVRQQERALLMLSQ